IKRKCVSLQTQVRFGWNARAFFHARQCADLHDGLILYNKLNINQLLINHKFCSRLLNQALDTTLLYCTIKIPSKAT
ncbi:hypothetical protein, partial [Phocaeicola plebeius]|uniref:hypothetical protein n=1 Tax=Phocaeicola plebeius TaxID=310297 RepID=UPI001C70548B